MTPLNTIIEEEKETLARQLHDWYLEATEQEDAKYNHHAVVPYEDLAEGQKLIDRYIAEKVLSLLASERADWLRSEIEKLERVKTNYVQGMENGLLHHREPCQCQTCVDERNVTLTSIITRYKEELLELDKTNGL